MLEKLILYFIVKTKGHITKTQLVKFLYLADLYAVKWTGKQLTELNWCYDNYGPWDKEIEDTLNILEHNNKITYKYQGKTILIQSNQSDDLTDKFNFSLSLELMLDNIRKEWAGNHKLDSLLDYVYSTEPMKEAKENCLFKIPLNLKLERQKLLTELGA